MFINLPSLAQVRRKPRLRKRRKVNRPERPMPRRAIDVGSGTTWENEPVPVTEAPGVVSTPAMEEALVKANPVSVRSFTPPFAKFEKSKPGRLFEFKEVTGPVRFKKELKGVAALVTVKAKVARPLATPNDLVKVPTPLIE